MAFELERHRVLISWVEVESFRKVKVEFHSLTILGQQKDCLNFARVDVYSATGRVLELETAYETSSTELDALLPSILDKTFKGEL